MIINTCTVILTIICQTSATYYDQDYTPNVGTVLFSLEDTSKPRWNKQDIGLLKARKYFQTLLPPPIFVNSFNEDYVDILLRYFKDAYATIKKEAFDTETDTIMTTALSDAIGGYLKVWVLPVAKLDYYGGTISQDNVIKLFKFYNEIKNYLDTDGSGWRTPDEDVLNTLTINVAPLKQQSNTRSNKDACDNLAYFEKTPDGLGVPIPYINWNEKLSTMFIPLKNVSLIQMNDPDSAQNLIKYYDTARGCIVSTNPKDQEKFDQRFQSWLASDVVPHLKDEHLYLALGSVLSLVNRTHEICENVMDMYNNKYYATNKQAHSIPKIPVDLTSKKMWIISIILLIEVAWCIPALIYILCTKKVNKKDCSSNVYLFIDKPDRKDKGYFHKAKPSHSKSNACSAIVNDPRPHGRGHDNPKCGIKLFRKSRLGNMEFEAQYPSTLATQTTHTVGTTAHTEYSSKEQSATTKTPSATTKTPSAITKTPSAITKTPSATTETTLPKKSSLKKTSSHNYITDSHTRILTLSSQDGYNYEVKRSTIENVAIIKNSIQSIQSVGEKYSPKNRKEKVTKRCSEKDESKQQNYLEDRKKIEERRKHEEKKKEQTQRTEDSRKDKTEHQRAEECRNQMEERQKPEENRRQKDERQKADEHRRQVEERQRDEYRKQMEERQRAEEHRKQMEERQRAEEHRKQMEERQKAEEHRKQMEERQRAEEHRKQIEERHKAEEHRKQIEERQKAEEHRKQMEELQKAEEYRKQLEERQRAEEYRRQMEDRQRAEECRRQIEERQQAEHSKKHMEERQKAETDCRRLEERQRTEDYKRQMEERQRTEEFQRYMEERQRAEECKRLEERQRAEECRRHMEEHKRVEEAKRQMEQRQRAEECRRLEERQRIEECRRMEEQQKSEELKRLEERRKTEELRKLEERKKAEEIRRQEERKKADEQKRLEERKKADELKKAEERRKAEESKRVEERKKADELRKAEERRKADEFKKNEERRKAEELWKAEERRKADELKKAEERKKAEEHRKHEERRKAEECKKIEERRRQEEMKKIEERKRESCCRKNDPPCCRNGCCKQEESSTVTEYSAQTNVIEVERLDFRSSLTEESEDYDTVNDMKSSTPLPCAACEDPVCSCTGCMKTGCRKTSTETESAISETDSKMSDKQVEVKSPRHRSQTRKESKCMKTPERSSKASSGKPYLEITIDKSAAEICVDVSRSMQKHSHKQLHSFHTHSFPPAHPSCKQAHSPKRPSKIPKLTGTNVIHAIAFDSRSPNRSLSPSEKRKSMIPKRQKKTVDDTVLNPCRYGNKTNKLNDTF